jgi:processive 1,2-diacylglycerol beta-glucosyltransferase
LEKLNSRVQEIIVAGTNKKLYKSLKRKIKKYKNRILLLGYVNNINELMAVSNIIISKPGGVTTAEVLAKRLPMIIVKPIPGQETNNTSYLTEKQAAIKIDDPKETNLIIESLLKHPDKLSKLQESAGRISKPNASQDIARLLLKL